MDFDFRLIIFQNQIEEEIGSTEEQSISNRFDVHSKNEGSLICHFLHFLVYLVVKKNYPKFDFYNTDTI